MFFSLMTLAGIGYGLYRGVKWMLRSGRSVAPREQPLTPNDLKVLEESAHRLMADLRAVTDECVVKVEAACARAERLVRQSESAPLTAQPDSMRDLSACESDESHSGMLTGEIQLLKGLQEILHR